MAKKVKSDVVEETMEKKEASFSKGQILASVRYSGRRDLVDALLKNNKKYTIEQVDKAINEYMKGQVN